jgi:hypothetical protein
MKTWNKLEFVTDEISQIEGISDKPSGGITSFGRRVSYALSLGVREKEIFFFCVMQWAAIGIGYLLWVQMLKWIPENVWRSAAESDGASIADVVMFVWSFVCVGIASYPIGVLTGCMGAAHFLHKQGRDSTIAMCIKLVMPRSWSLWAFHWIDGWVTVSQILERLPKKNDRRTLEQRASSEAIYYAWKLGVAGVLPSVVTGNDLVLSGRNSISFVKHNFVKVAKLRAGYSALCWIVGVGAYMGAILFFLSVDVVPKGDEIYGHVYAFYFWAAVPILVAVGVVVLFLRPIYVISVCDLYSDHLKRQGAKIVLPESPPKSISSLVVFVCFCILVLVAMLYREQLGIVNMLSLL